MEGLLGGDSGCWVRIRREVCNVNYPRLEFGPFTDFELGLGLGLGLGPCTNRLGLGLGNRVGVGVRIMKLGLELYKVSWVMKQNTLTVAETSV